jgi:pilus assembly protein Flp/PilA
LLGLRAPGILTGRYIYSVFTFSQDLLIRLLRRDERGATAVEYGLIVALIAAAIAVALLTMGQDLTKLFRTIGGDF